jgi:hypothetical protein
MEYLAAKQQEELVSRLLDLTRDAKIRWELMTHEHSFLSAARHFVFIIRARDQSDAAPFKLDVVDIRKKRYSVLQTLDSDGDERLRAPLETLYFLVKRELLRVEDTARDLFTQLDELEARQT